MPARSEDEHNADLSDFEQQIARAEAALDAMPAPSPATSRQVIIATRERIKRQIKTHGAEAVWQTYVAIGHKVKFSTFRDYIYNGLASREAKGVEVARKARRTRKVTVAAVETSSEQVFVTESSSNGTPVRARKLL